MPNSQTAEIIRPGIDSRSHTQDLHQNVATGVSQMTGKSVTPQEVTPMVAQSPAQSVEQKPGFELDLEDIISRERGKGGDEESKHFLGMLKERLLKKNPGKEIKAE